MIFKNITLMKMAGHSAEQWDIRCSLTGAALQQAAQKGCGLLQQCSVGFAPIIDGSDDLSNESGNCTLFRLSKQERKVPSSVLKAALKDRIESHRSRMNRTPGKRVRDQLKDEVLAELLPKAFVDETFYTAYIDWDSGMLVVNTASDRVAEMFVDRLRKVFESMPVEPIATEQSVGGLMTLWVHSGELPCGFTNGSDADMKDPLDTRAQVKVRYHDLRLSEVVEHVQQGKRVTQLALSYENRITFCLDEAPRLRKIKFTDVANGALSESMGDEADKRAEFDATFAFMTLEFRQLIRALDKELGFQ